MNDPLLTLLGIYVTAKFVSCVSKEAQLKKYQSQQLL